MRPRPTQGGSRSFVVKTSRRKKELRGFCHGRISTESGCPIATGTPPHLSRLCIPVRPILHHFHRVQATTQSAPVSPLSTKFAPFYKNHRASVCCPFLPGREMVSVAHP